jgi:hypothetical protein
MDTPPSDWNVRLRKFYYEWRERIGKGGPQHTSMAVRRRKTRSAICARVTDGAPVIDIIDSMAEEPGGARVESTNSFYRADQV